MLFSRQEEEKEKKIKDIHTTKVFGTEDSDSILPKYKLKKKSMDPDLAYRVIKDELLDEGSARLNLATFCQTYMEPAAVKIMSETLEKNAIDKSEYPQTTDLENRCVNMIADLWNAPKDMEFIGTSTVGSSEACMLGGLAMKFSWREWAKTFGLNINAQRPNLVISSGFQVCWEKFCVYWDIDMRLVPLDEEHMSLNMDTILDYVDDYTIGIVAIMGITYTGKYDDVEKLDALVEAHNQKTGHQIPIHVDAASGGMFAPFIHPDLKWDFRLKNVISINTSGHKYGLVYPGVGWVIWKDKKYLPAELIFSVSYLGGDLPTIAINFSRSASQIIGQYFNFLSYGFDGYQEIHQRTREVARYIANELMAIGLFDIYNNGDNIPIVCWKMKADANREWSLYDLADRVRMNGWQVPAYPLPANMTDIIIQRVVIRQDLSMQLAELFINDLKEGIHELDNARVIVYGNAIKDKGTYGFTH
ncbi:glutamate decarboxylase [Acetobacterium bakii]|uniref:Glutamate decarboxylase n=1 Tax=Acetobacterium bakii TaxID=52689 RepID=A0A0L6U104_9FIRM|nr:glutamate decarboxylase [Acetobacterium bakii]KNZ42189.1 glutamate decarboxylase [Acetobacterium bakii]